MRVSILQENLAKGLSIVGRAVSPRSTLPVLANILLSTDDNRLKLAATNLEIGVTCWLGAQVDDDGAITLPARLLTDWVSVLPPDPVQMEMVLRNMSMNLRCARFESNIKGIDANEFPLIPVAEGDDCVQLPVATLRNMIEQVVFAAASGDESRVSLTGVLTRFEGNHLTMAATDGFRLSVRRTVLPLPVAVDQAVIIPARALAEVARIAGEADQERAIDIAVSSARSQVLFRLQGKGEAEHGGFHHVDLVSQLIDAKFPDFNAIIPKNSVTRSIVDTAALAKAVRAASLFVPGVARNVRLSINPGSGGAGSIALAANSPEMGDTASEIDAEIEGGPLEIAFNARYMQDVLNVVGTPRVLLETTQNNRPGLIRPIGAEPEEFLHVIMPMQLQK